MTTFREADAAELASWDERTVRGDHGHVLQSRAWAAHRERTGWRPWFLVGSDGSAVLALSRPWPLLGGGGAYLPRGPVPDGTPGEVAERLAGVTLVLAERGIDVVASDAEVPAETGYPGLIAALGFRPIEEIQPSRHRITLPLGATTDESAVFAAIAKSARQRIRQAEAGTIVVRHDARCGPGEPGDGFVEPGEDAAAALDRFYDLLLETGRRRRFSFGPRRDFVDWWRAALGTGMLVYLEARTAAGAPIAGLLCYRHGRRLSTAHSGDLAGARRAHPGVLHFLRWRAIQLAIREGCAEMDLGGVDVPGARREPRPGDPMFGLYQLKLAFGGRWVSMTGAHERVIRPPRYLAGRLVAATARRGSSLLRR